MVHYKTELLLHRPVDARWIRNFLTFICCKIVLSEKTKKTIIEDGEWPLFKRTFSTLS